MFGSRGSKQSQWQSQEVSFGHLSYLAWHFHVFTLASMCCCPQVSLGPSSHRASPEWLSVSSEYFLSLFLILSLRHVYDLFMMPLTVILGGRSMTEKYEKGVKKCSSTCSGLFSRDSLAPTTANSHTGAPRRTMGLCSAKPTVS